MNTPVNPPNLQTKISLELTVEQVNLLLSIVSTRPLSEVLDLFVTIRSQGEKQLAPPSSEKG